MKFKLKDYQGAINDYNLAIENNSENKKAYLNRGISKEKLLDIQGACSDWMKASSLGIKRADEWIKNQCPRRKE